MKQIDHSLYQQLVDNAEILERDGYGEKVLAMADGTLVKIFRRKRRLTSALFYPYARRFANNARRLAELGVLTVNVLEIAYCPAVERHLVTYQPLPGRTLRQILRLEETRRSRLFADFASFVAGLHHQGIYFRSLHFGNVIVPDEGRELGLIDIADMSFLRKPLPVRLRVRNFRHILRYREDTGYLLATGSDQFLDQYLTASALPPSARANLRALLAGLVQAPPAAG